MATQETEIKRKAELQNTSTANVMLTLRDIQKKYELRQTARIFFCDCDGTLTTLPGQLFFNIFIKGLHLESLLNDGTFTNFLVYENDQIYIDLEKITQHKNSNETVLKTDIRDIKSLIRDIMYQSQIDFPQEAFPNISRNKILFIKKETLTILKELLNDCSKHLIILSRNYESYLLPLFSFVLKNIIDNIEWRRILINGLYMTNDHENTEQQNCNANNFINFPVFKRLKQIFRNEQVVEESTIGIIGREWKNKQKVPDIIQQILNECVNEQIPFVYLDDSLSDLNAVFRHFSIWGAVLHKVESGNLRQDQYQEILKSLEYLASKEESDQEALSSEEESDQEDLSLEEERHRDALSLVDYTPNIRSESEQTQNDENHNNSLRQRNNINPTNQSTSIEEPENQNESQRICGIKLR